MKLIYFCNLFILCSSAFIIQPSNSLKSNLNICRCYSLPPNHFYKKNTINNFLKKNDNDIDDIDNIDIDNDKNIKLMHITIFLLIALKILINSLTVV